MHSHAGAGVYCQEFAYYKSVGEGTVVEWKVKDIEVAL